MARNYLTSLNLNKNELLNARVQNLANAPANPVAGQIYFDTALGHLRQYTGSAWITYTTAAELQTALTAGTQTNITVSYDTNTGTYSFVAENGVADSTTADLAEDPNATTSSGTMYFTNERAIAAVGGSATSANTPDTVVKRDEEGSFAAQDITANSVIIGNAGNITDGSALEINSAAGTNLSLTGSGDVNIFSTGGDIVLNADGNVYKGSVLSDNEIITQGRLDQYIGDGTVTGSTGNTVSDRIGTVASNLSTHINDSSAHGTTGNVVGDTDAQTLTNKTLGSGTVLSADVDANGHTITDLGDPTVDSDAVPKGYLDLVLGNHESDTSTHGVGTIVGTSEAQTLTNKTLGSGNVLSADLDADEFKVINLATPTAPGDAANKAYVDNAVAGLTWKPAVHLLATGNVALTGDSDTLVIDGHASLDASSVGYRILLTAQSTDTENGIYVYADDSVTYTLTRAADSDVYTELKGATVFVQEGTTYGQSAWTQGNTYLTSFADQDWVQFSGAAQIVAGHGLTKTGNTLDVVGTADRITANADSIDIASTYAGQTSIDTVGTITTGTWNGTDIAVADGGTGSSTAAGARANLGATTKYTEANPELTVSSGVVTWTVTHSLGIRTVLVQVYDLAGFEEVEVDIERTNTSTVKLSWVSATTVAASSYQVVIIG